MLLSCYDAFVTVRRNFMKYILKRNLALLAVCISTLSACNSSFFLGKDNSVPPTPLTQIVPTSAVNVLWSAPIGGGIGKHFYRFAPAISNEKVLSADRNGNVVALDQATGRIIWKSDVGRVRVGVGVGQNFAFASNESGELLALNLSDGQVAWKQKMSGNAISIPVAKNNTVVVRIISGAVMAFDESTGNIKWTYSIVQPEIVLSGGASAVFVDDMVLIPTDRGQLGALELETGRVLWGKTFARPRGPNIRTNMSDVDASLIIDDGIAYVSTLNGAVSAISLKDSRTLWESKVSSFAGMGLAQDILYVTDENSQLIALSTRDGAQLWSSDVLRGRRLTRPVAANQAILVGDFEGFVHAIDPRSGALLGSQQVASSGFLPDVIKSNTGIYLQDRSGKLYKLSL